MVVHVSFAPSETSSQNVWNNIFILGDEGYPEKRKNSPSILVRYEERWKVKL